MTSKTSTNAKFIMTTALLMNLVGFANYAAVLPALRTATGISEAQAGIAGGVFFLSYAIGSPIFAGLTDTRDARKLFVIGCAIGVAGGFVFPMISDSYAALVLGRSLTGLGIAGTYMPGMRLLMESVPSQRQSLAAGGYVSALTLGLSCSFALSGLLEWWFSWQAAFIGAAACAALAMAIVGSTMPSTNPLPAQASLLARLSKASRARNLNFVLLAAAGNSWEGMGFRTWWVAMLSYTATVPGNESFGWLNFALATAFAGPLAMPISAWVARRAESGRRHRVIATAASSSVLVALTLGAFVDSTLPVAFFLSVIYMCAIFSDAGALTPAALACAPPEERGAVLALQSAASNIGAFASVIVSGWVLHICGGFGSSNAWRWTIFLLAAGSVVTALAMLRVDTRRSNRNE